MPRPLVVPSLLLVLLLAGCAGVPSAELEQEAFAPAAASGTGRLEGSVVSDQFVGVPGALVKVLGTSEARKTDLQGRFVFDSVAPGPVRLRVEAPGWVPAQVSAQIEEGATTQVTVFVDPLLVSEPYSDLWSVRGKLNCVAVRVIGTTTEGMACDTYRRELGFPQDWAGTVTEVTWSKGATSTPYSRVSLLDENATDGRPYARQIAESPAKIVLRPNTLHTQYQATATTPAMHKSGTLAVEIAKSPVEIVGVPVHLGLTIDQEFELFHTTFYVETPPGIDDYSALPED